MQNIDVERVAQDLFNWSTKQSENNPNLLFGNWKMTIRVSREVSELEFKNVTHKIEDCYTDTQAQRVLVIFYGMTGRELSKEAIDLINELLWGSVVVLFNTES